MSETIAHLTSATFADAIAKSPTPILVDFWAPWCGPCKAIGPLLEELANELAGKLTIAKVDIEESDNRDLAVTYGIQGIPTLILFKGGQPIEKFVGTGQIGDKATLRAKLGMKL